MLGSLISAGASILGGFLGKQSADETREAQERQFQQNLAAQKEFAQSGIQWRVADAKAAGIHPIYAIGGSGASYSPSTSAFTADTSLPNALASAGQDVGRAIDATRSGSDRATARIATALTLEKAGLENDLLRTEIASKTGRLRQVTQPVLPTDNSNYLVPGQAQSGLVKPKPLEVAPGHPGSPSSEGGAIADVGYARTTTGWAPVPSKDVKERIEDQIVPELMWSMRNNLFPSFGGNMTPPPFKPPPGKEWTYDAARQEYQLINNKDHLYKQVRDYQTSLARGPKKYVNEWRQWWKGNR